MGNKNSALIRVPYDNYKMIHPDGTLMCFCSKKKATWYANKGLATLEGNNVNLSFVPNGYGDPFVILEGRSNICVISGETSHLTKHHVIPTQYRKHFRSKFKDKNSSDLMVLTRKTHDKYELSANDFKEKLYNEYVSPDLISKFNELSEAKSLENTLSKHISKIPPSKQIYMQMKLEGILERWNISLEDLKDINYDPFDDINKIIVHHLGEINLIVLWKLHFIKYGKPKHLPNWWKPNLIKIIKTKNDILAKSELYEADLKNKILTKLLIKYDLYETAKLYF
mgnify:CR=1 FL=1